MTVGPTAQKWKQAPAFGEGVALDDTRDNDSRSCLNTGQLDPQSLPGTGFPEFLPFHQWALDGDLMTGPRGESGGRTGGRLA